LPWAALCAHDEYRPEGRARRHLERTRSRRRRPGSPISPRAVRLIRRSPGSCSSAPAQLTTIFVRYSGSSASPRVPSWFVFCLMAARRT